MGETEGEREEEGVTAPVAVPGMVTVKREDFVLVPLGVAVRPAEAVAREVALLPAWREALSLAVEEALTHTLALSEGLGEGEGEGVKASAGEGEILTVSVGLAVVETLTVGVAEAVESAPEALPLPVEEGVCVDVEETLILAPFARDGEAEKVEAHDAEVEGEGERDGVALCVPLTVPLLHTETLRRVLPEAPMVRVGVEESEGRAGEALTEALGEDEAQVEGVLEGVGGAEGLEAAFGEGVETSTGEGVEKSTVVAVGKIDWEGEVEAEGEEAPSGEGVAAAGGGEGVDCKDPVEVGEEEKEGEAVGQRVALGVAQGEAEAEGH